MHLLNKESKVPSKVVHDIHKALEKDQTLTTHELMTGNQITVLILATSSAMTL